MTKLPPLILLAAGKSARMGAPKALLVVEGKTWIRRQLESYFVAGGSKAWVVTGFWADEIEGEVRGVANVAVVRNPDPQRGQFSSIQAGAQAVLQDAEIRSAFLLPIDTPAPAPETWAKLVVSAEASVPVLDGRGGHPVLLSRAILEKMVTVAPGAPDARLDAQIHSSTRVLRIAVEDPRVRLNINTPEDFAAFVKGLESAPSAR